MGRKKYFLLNIIVKYCKLKAANILKCLKQGIEPPRGNPNNPDPPPSAETKAPDTNPGAGNPPSMNIPKPPVSDPKPPVPHFIEPPAPHFMEPPPSNIPPANLQPPKSTNAPQSLFLGTPQYTGAAGSASTLVTKRKVDIKNPYNEMGKIVRQHPKYFEVLDKAQKLMEHAMNDLGSKSLSNAAKNLEDAFKLLDLLEN